MAMFDHYVSFNTNLSYTIKKLNYCVIICNSHVIDAIALIPLYLKHFFVLYEMFRKLFFFIFKDYHLTENLEETKNLKCFNFLIV